MTKRTTLKNLVLSAMLIACSANLLAKIPAQQLAEKVTGPDTLAFIATSGTDHIGEDFNNSTLGMLWADPQLQQFITAARETFFTELTKTPSTTHPDLQFKLLSELLKCPVALVISAGPEPFSAVLIAECAGHKTSIQEPFDAMLRGDKDQASFQLLLGHRLYCPEEDKSFYAGFADDRFIIALGDNKGKILSRLKNSSNQSPPRFSQLTEAGDAFAMYADIPAILKLAQSKAAEENGSDDWQMVETILDKLGLANVGTVASRVGFKNQDLVTDSIVEIKGQPTGLWTALKPVNYTALSKIDDRAMNVTLTNFDFAAVADIIAQTAKAVIPADEYTELQSQVAALEEQFAVSIRKDIIDSFAGPVTFYTVPAGAVMDAPRGAAAAAIRITDAAKVEALLQKLAAIVQPMQNDQMQLSTLEKNGRTYYHITSTVLSFAGVLPSWTVDGDYLVFATSAALCEQTADQFTGKPTAGTQLLENDRFKAAVDTLPKDAVFFSYTDSRAQLRAAVLSAQQFWPMLNMMLSQQGIKLPVMLPNFSAVIDKVQGSVSYAQFTPAGLRSTYKGAGVETCVGLGVSSLSAAILMPALNNVRHVAQRITAGSILKDIGVGLHVFAMEHDGQFPPDIETLRRQTGLDLEKGVREPENFDGPGYIYVPGRTTASSDDTILAYENPAYLSSSDKINVLFVDGHVAALNSSEFRQLVAKDPTIPPIRFQAAPSCAN